jgi:hypothetical protein
MMICGIVMYIEVSSRLGAIDYLTSQVLRFSPTTFLAPILFAFSALLSVFSSSSGVVMPLFISLAPGLSTVQLDATSIVIGVAISAHLVDVSPLSSLGALCIAASETEQKEPGLFRRLLIWSFVMVPVGALISWLLAA